MELITENAQETKGLGKRIGSGLGPKNKAVVLALEGNLGAGKTTFIQGLAEGLGITKRILSPTFILMREYKVNNNSAFKDFYHLDLYRLEDNLKDEIRSLGVFDIYQDPQSIIAIEWAEKAQDTLPDDHIHIKFEHLSEDKRRVLTNVDGL